MRLNQLQSEIEGHYDVSTPHRVEDFLFHDPHLAGLLSNDPSLQGAPEALLVAQADDGLDVSLFLDRGVLDRLEQQDPQTGLHNGNLTEFWIALEGVSHFLYLVWSATFGRQVTRLEMELQAEVDKFVIAARWLARQYGRVSHGALRRLLFEDVGYRSALDGDSSARYREANRLAARYCESLGDSVGSDVTPAATRSAQTAELRRFYRMGQRQKIRHIEAAAAARQ